MEKDLQRIEHEEWKEAFGNRSGEYTQQMWLRKLPTRENMADATKIKHLIKYDRQHDEEIRNYRALTNRQ